MANYIIQKIGMEYNDEIYCPSESEGGEPCKIYTDLTKAQEECSRLNEQEWIGLNPYEYSDEISDDDFDEDIQQWIQQDPKYHWRRSISHKIPKETLKRLAKIMYEEFDIRFYRVVNCEVVS